MQKDVYIVVYIEWLTISCVKNSFMQISRPNTICRDLIIEKQLMRLIMIYSKCLSYPLPFNTTQKITLFLIPASANHDKVNEV